MPIIPHTTRSLGRYTYRRRIHFRNVISRVVVVSLQTADPEIARARSALLSVRFAAVTARLRAMYTRGGLFMTGEEILAVYQSELREALEMALAEIYRSDKVDVALWQTSLLAEAYGVARRLDRPSELSPADEAGLAARNVSEGDIEFIKCDLDMTCADHALPDLAVAARLEAAGLLPTHELVRLARLHVLRARADSYRRALHLPDPLVQDAPNPVAALLDARFDRAAITSPAYTCPGSPKPAIAQVPDPSPSPVPPVPAPSAITDSYPFIHFDERPFSTVIGEIIDELRAERTWKGDCAQQRRIMTTFAWITGVKPLGAYTHLDVAAFKRGLMRLPTTFRFGSLTAGAMSMPFDISSLPPVQDDEKRNGKTINRDLSTMSTVARRLSATAWAPRIPNTSVLDFAAATISIKDDGVDTRPPWTPAHLEALFRSPLYVGGGGVHHRLEPAARPDVSHDAAFFAPLLWYYHHACREEICGLRVDEVVIDHPVPHFIIKDNDVRGRDGELAGEKRVARRRALPIHPELLRLGFQGYARAIEREGHQALFPELYVNEAKRGGAQFYNVAWRHMVDWIEDRMPLPRNKRQGSRHPFHPGPGQQLLRA